MGNILSRKSRKTDSEIVQTLDDGLAEANYLLDRPLHEIVLSFDHILEQIFNSLDTPDLLTCRLVSHRYLKIAYRLLNRWISRTFCCGTDVAELERFIVFLEQSALFSETNPNRILFPCTNFKFFEASLPDEILQKFLNINGQNVRSLKVHSSSGSPVDENALMEQLTNLLTVQAPQLEKLSLKTFFHVQRTPVIVDYPIFRSLSDTVNNSSLLNTSPKFQQISSRVESLPRKSNLKALEICGRGLTTTMEFLLQLSPKLQQLAVEDSHYLHLLHPVNRVHLLNCLSIIPEQLVEGDFQEDPEFVLYVETLEKISLDKNLRLRKLTMNFWSAPYALRTDLEFQKKVVSLINRVLESSKETLEILNLTSFTYLPGIKVPAPMPRVHEIKIVEVDERYRENGTVFPKGFSLMEVFPKLTFVKPGFFPAFYNDVLFNEYLKRLDFAGDGEDALSLGVKKVILDSWDSFTNSFRTVPSFFTQKILTFFPSANIEFTNTLDC